MRHLDTSPEAPQFFDDQREKYGQLPPILRSEIEEVIDWGKTSMENFDEAIHAELPVLKAWEVTRSIYDNDLYDRVKAKADVWLSEIMPDGKSVDSAKLHQTIRYLSGIDLSTLPNFERVAPVVLSAFSRFLVDTYPGGPSKIEQKYFTRLR